MIMRQFIIFFCCMAIFISVAEAKMPDPLDINPKDFEQLVTKDNGKHKMLFIFASWCGQCKKNFPYLLDLHKEYSSQNVEFFPISFDENPMALDKYIGNQPDSSLQVYRFSYRNRFEVGAMFGRLGINYSGAIPHTVLVNPQKQILADGNYRLEPFKKGLELLMNK